ncbi:MAG: hypothetical protein Q8Q82_17395 [Hydrogenophaga sp.]|jgi:hypothetical protein|nr:hypothetical protein [Hydrogenophaga sp.]
MKTDRAEKKERALHQAEADLRAALQKLLPEAAKTGLPVFVNSRFRPEGMPSAALLTAAEGFLVSAQECVRLRQEIGLPIESSIGHVYLSMCSESASTDPHRRGPRKLAEALLEQLQHDA